jgi:iron complex outermembrane receptor protein
MRATRKTAIAAALALLCHAAHAVDPPPPRVALTIEQQPLRTALKSLADQTGLQIIWREENVSADGMTSPRLVGEMSPQEALDKLLVNSGLTYRFLNDRTVRILKVGERADLSSESVSASERGAQQTSVGADTGLLQEIIVSARRQEESLTEVPASVTAYSADFIQKQNIQSFADYATKIPNLTFQYGQASGFSATGFSGGRVTTIRGVAGTNTTAYYLNETPIPSSVSPQTLGLDRIEVLKGPQGTLFGASSMGGNLRFITREPSLTHNSYTVEAQGGHTHSAGADYGLDALAGMVLIPDTMALDVAFGYTHESGFITRRFPDPYPSGNLLSKDDQGRSNLFSGSVSLRTQLTDQLAVTVSALGQDSTLMGYPTAYVPLPGYEPLSYTVDRDRDVREYSKDRWGLGSVVLNYAGTGFSFVSSTSYFSRRVKEQEDVTEGTNQFIEEFYELDVGDPAFPTRNIVTDRRFTHESRVAFDEDLVIPHVSGIAGVFYQRDTLIFRQPGIVIPALADAGFDPAYLSDFRFPSHEDNKAVFGELYYEVVPKLTVTLGLRQYWIKQQADAIFSTGFLSTPGGDVSPATRNSQSGRVPKMVVSYKIGDEGTVYASAAKGFRAGGSQPSLTDDFCVPDLAALGLTKKDVEAYKPDTLWSYELGAKSKLADGRVTLSSALFQVDWSSMQQTVLLPTCTLSFISNAGKARIRGGELEVSAQPLAAVPLTVELGLGYSDGVLRDPGLLPQAANTPLAQVPELTGSIAGYYQTPINETLDLFVAADYAYTDSVKVVNSDGGFVTRRPFNILNGNVGLRFGNSEVLVYGKNLLDKQLNYGDIYANGFERLELATDGELQRLPRAAVSRPRQVGVQYRMSF